jgi:hypothetical protein
MVSQWFGLKTTGIVCQWFGFKTIGTVSFGLASKPVVTVSPSLASKLVVTFSPSLASKPVVMVSPGLASKPLARVSRFGSQNWQLRFGDFGIKITMMVSWFGTQNQAGFGLSVTPQNRRKDEDGVGHASRSSGLLRVEASQAKFS